MSKKRQPSQPSLFAYFKPVGQPDGPDPRDTSDGETNSSTDKGGGEPEPQTPGAHRQPGQVSSRWVVVQRLWLSAVNVSRSSLNSDSVHIYNVYVYINP